ncbi:MAG: hypothetical protein ABSF96_13140 [Steroidobacteraceae bacterium]
MRVKACCPHVALRALGAGAVAICLLTGCSLFHPRTLALGCSERPFQGSMDAGRPLNVPASLSAPDTRNNVKVPVLDEPEQPRARSAPCLAMPPSFAGGEAESVRSRLVPAMAAPAGAPSQSPPQPQPQPQ